MENKQVLSGWLRPKYESGSQIWLNLIDTVDKNIIWYPSARNNFDDLLFTFPGDNNQEIVYIHTDYFPDDKLFQFLNGEIEISNQEGNIIYKLVESVELISKQIIPEIDYNNISKHLAVLLASINNNNDVLKNLQTMFPAQNDLAGINAVLRPKSFDDLVNLSKNENFKFANKIFLLNIFVKDDLNSKQTNRNVIYFFIDNFIFLENVVIKGGLKLSLIWNKYNI